MARIRTIKPEFWSDEKVTECSLSSRLLFIGLWNFADDAGRLEDSTRQIKARVFPADDLTSDDIHGLLNELSVNGLIIRYKVEGKAFIQIKGWRHQNINRPTPSKIPQNADGDHGTLSEGSLLERKGEEGKGKEESPLPPKPDSRKGDDEPTHGEVEAIAARIAECADKSFDLWRTRGDLRPARQVRAWLQAGWDAERLVARAREILTGKAVNDPFTYLAKALKDEAPHPPDSSFDKAAEDRAQERWRAAHEAWDRGGGKGPMPRLADFQGK